MLPDYPPAVTALIEAAGSQSIAVDDSMADIDTIVDDLSGAAITVGAWYQAAAGP